MLELYDKYGYFIESLRSLTLKGKEGTEKIASILNEFRQSPPTVIAGLKVTAVEDDQTQVRTNLQSGETETIQLPKSNVLKYFLENGAWFCVRPSRTEPKAKFYFGVNAKMLEESKELNQRLQTEVMAIVESM